MLGAAVVCAFGAHATYAKSEAELYPRMLERMRHRIVIGVAHHAALTPLHNVIATVSEGKVSYEKTAAIPAASRVRDGKKMAA